ncbi:Spy/CpxP family protein refolding chaperone [Maridesulfovibrio sp. FT414]|uniref:Spy/CpxP family protein refolding chaperone n=1 Tax=Maridesulfovibrio sp. FT414 TaxID=2979469 RepID=UPI003D807CD1
MKKTIVIPVMVIMVLALAGTAMARGGCNGAYGGGPGYGQGYGPCTGPAQMFDQLTPEKQQEVKAIFQKYDDKIEAVRSQMWAKRTELNALVEAGKAEKKDITALVNDMAALRDKGYNLRKQLSAEIEQATGIAMPVPGFGGNGMDNGKMGFGRHHRGDDRGGNCWNWNS